MQSDHRKATRPFGSDGFRARTGLASLVLGVAMLVSAGVAVLAVHTENLFELGPSGTAPFTATTATNIVGDGIFSNGPDWADLFTTPCTTAAGCAYQDAIKADGSSGSNGVADYLDYGGSAAGFLKDTLAVASSLDGTTFSGYGTSNKNTDPISTADCANRTPPLTGSACAPWGWAPGNVPAKDDLANVYSYAVVPSSGHLAGHLILYAGLERIDPSGDSHVDIEFFQDPNVGLCSGTGCDTFTGTRTVGDLIVSMDYLQGGALGSVSIHRWNGSTYVLLGTETGVGCVAKDGTSGDDICAFNNEVPISGGNWPSYDNHGHVITTLPTNAFTEMGFDLTSFFSGTTPCISTFMAKTRSSGSFTSELKDFAGPQAFPICSAQISITPGAVNEVGHSHTFTVTVQKKVGTDVSAVPGIKPTVTLTTANGAVVSNEVNDCASNGTDSNGRCTVTFTSNSAGTVTGSATATVAFGGDSFTVTTDGTGSNSPPAVKRFVDGKISITPTKTNEVGHPHTFTVTVLQDDGLSAAQGGDGVTGFGPAPIGTNPTITLTDANGAVHTTPTGTCYTTGTNSSGECTVTFNSDTPGTVTGHASATFTVGGVSITRATDSTHGSSGDAVKTYVDANITITPPGTNGITENHTFTVTVKENDGSGPTYTNVPDGTSVAVTLTDAGGAVHSISANSCDTSANDPATSAPGVGTVNGQCAVTFTSDTAGTVTGHASVTLTIGGVSIARATGDSKTGDSGDVVKTFVAGSISWIKHDNAGNLLGGATFTVCRTQDRFGNDVTDTSDACKTGVLDNSSLDSNKTDGQFQLTGLLLGHYVITESAAPAGWALDSTSQTADLTLLSPSATLSTAFVDQRPIIKITGFGYTNSPVGTPTAGVLHGTAVFTVDLHNYGGATADLSGSLAVTDSGAGTLVCAPTSPITISGTLAAGADSTPVSISCEYDLTDGSTVTATLNVSYTINGLTRVASGSPAMITFTAQGD